MQLGGIAGLPAPASAKLSLMRKACTVLIAAPDLQVALRERIGADDPVLAFSDAEPIEALSAITRERPSLVALERLFAASPRGAALMARIKADPALRTCEIRVLSHDGAYSRVSPRRAAAAAPPAAKGALDATGTRRARRFRIQEGVVALIDGNTARVVDLSVLGAQIVSPGVVRPNQRVKFSLKDEQASITVSATIVWARFEMVKGAQGPTYRAGIEFANADAGPIEAFADRHRA